MQGRKNFWCNQKLPGNIFHPHFLEGHPTYLDVSVCNPLAPGIVKCTFAVAGSAGLLGEALKDAKHEATVEKAGVVFVPLLLRCLDCGLLLQGRCYDQ